MIECISILLASHREKVLDGVREKIKGAIVECSRECERSGDVCSNGTAENIEAIFAAYSKWVEV